jgi:hypothetical protein
MLSAGTLGEASRAPRGYDGRVRWGLQLVAAGDTRELAAGEQHEVQERARHSDRALDPATAGELGGAANRHGGRL